MEQDVLMVLSRKDQLELVHHGITAFTFSYGTFCHSAYAGRAGLEQGEVKNQESDSTSFYPSAKQLHIVEAKARTTS